MNLYIYLTYLTYYRGDGDTLQQLRDATAPVCFVLMQRDEESHERSYSAPRRVAVASDCVDPSFLWLSSAALTLKTSVQCSLRVSAALHP